MTDVLQHNTLTTICGQRDAAIAAMEKAVHHMQEGLRLALLANEHAQQAHGSATFILEDRSKLAAYQRLFESIDPAVSLEAFRQQTDARTWMNLMALTGMGHLMDKTAKDEFYAQLLGQTPEVTEDTVLLTFDELKKKSGLIFQRGLARAFIDLDRRFRSHDGFKLGSRVVLTHVFNSWGMWSWHGSGTSHRDTIADLERIFAVLDGNRERLGSGSDSKPLSLLDAIDRDRGRGTNARQSVTEAEYFRVRTYMNGNAHLWFTRDDLVEKANLVLADYYGEVLPDGVPGDVTDRDIRQKSTALCKDLSFYETPQAVIDEILGDTYFGADSVCLEPSAGQGAMVKAMLRRGAGCVDAVEVAGERVAQLQVIERSNPRLTVHQRNFLTMPPTPRYTRIVMNPPFYGTHYMQHVMHAHRFLAPGGKLIAVLPATAEFGESKAHVAFREWLEKHSDRYGRTFHDLPLESFAASGTRVNTCYVVLKGE